MPEPTAQIDESILHDIKQMLGQEWDDPTYDLDIKNHINTVFFNLNQLGVGPVAGFMIQDANAKWVDYIGTRLNLNAVKTYIWIRVKLLFDPPATGPMMESLQKQADKIEWTLMVEVDPPVQTPLGVI